MAEPPPSTHGLDGRPERSLWVDVLQTVALLAAVTGATALIAPHPPASRTARPGGVIAVAPGPQAANGSFVLLAGTAGEVRVTVRARGGDGAARPAGTVRLDADGFVTRGQVRCLRTTPTSAVIGLSATAESLATGRRERRSGVVVLQRRSDESLATYRLDLGRTPPDCDAAPRIELLPMTGRVEITRR